MRKRELDFVEKIMRAKRKKLLVISGPSQSGKRSIIKQVTFFSTLNECNSEKKK